MSFPQNEEEKLVIAYATLAKAPLKHLQLTASFFARGRESLKHMTTCEDLQSRMFCLLLIAEDPERIKRAAAIIKLLEAASL